MLVVLSEAGRAFLEEELQAIANGYAEHDMRTHGRQLGVGVSSATALGNARRLAKRLTVSAQQAIPKLEPVLRQSEVPPIPWTA